MPQAAQAAPPKRAAAKAARAAGWRRSKMIVLPLALATILSACAAYSITSHGEADGAPGASKAAERRGAAGKDAGQAAAQLAAAFASRPGLAPSVSPASSAPASGSPASSAELASSALAASSAPTSSATVAQSPAPQRKATPQQLREAFRNRLAEVDLLKRINLDLRDNEWTMQASLDADEAARFDRILKAFVQAHNIKFPVHARVGSAEVMLPFRVREVITGANAGIVTQDGRRLYVGDEYRGLRLVAVEGSHLQFDGERKIKVQW
jgi:type III secretion protein D